MLQMVNLVCLLATNTNWNSKAICWEITGMNLRQKHGFLSKPILSILALVDTLLPIHKVPGGRIEVLATGLHLIPRLEVLGTLFRLPLNIMEWCSHTHT
jgi:hypothetical protein